MFHTRSFKIYPKEGDKGFVDIWLNSFKNVYIGGYQLEKNNLIITVVDRPKTFTDENKLNMLSSIGVVPRTREDIMKLFAGQPLDIDQTYEDKTIDLE